MGDVCSGWGGGGPPKSRQKEQNLLICDSDKGGGGQRIRKSCGRHIWKPPYRLRRPAKKSRFYVATLVRHFRSGGFLDRPPPAVSCFTFRTRFPLIDMETLLCFMFFKLWSVIITLVRIIYRLFNSLLQTCRKIRRLGCVTRARVWARFTQPNPLIAFHVCTANFKLMITSL